MTVCQRSRLFYRREPSSGTVSTFRTIMFYFVFLLVWVWKQWSLRCGYDGNQTCLLFKVIKLNRRKIAAPSFTLRFLSNVCRNRSQRILPAYFSSRCSAITRKRMQSYIKGRIFCSMNFIASQNTIFSPFISYTIFLQRFIAFVSQYLYTIIFRMLQMPVILWRLHLFPLQRKFDTGKR